MVNDSISALKNQLQSEIEQLKAHHTEKHKAIRDQTSALESILEKEVDRNSALRAQREQDIANRNKAHKAHLEAEMRKNKHALESKLERDIEEKNTALKAELISNLEAHIEREFAIKDNHFCMQDGNNCTGKDLPINMHTHKIQGWDSTVS